jgi:AraC-like DNA-binding protein
MPVSADLLDGVLEQPDYAVIHGNMLEHFSDLVEDLGGDPFALLEKAGALPQPCAGEIMRFTYRQFVAMLEFAAAELNCLDFGMRLAVRQSPIAFASTLGEGMRNSRTLGEALQFVSSHSYAHSLAAWIWINESASRSKFVVGHDILLENLPQRSQAMEYILLVGNLATLELTEKRVRARCVLFRHQPITTMKNYRRYFGCDVRFGRSADALVYNDQDLTCSIFAADPQLYQAAGSMLENKFLRHKPPFHADVRGVVFHLLGSQACDRERVAAALNMHPRTMLRRLTNEGTTFLRIKDEVRRDRLLYYVGQTDLNFAAVSEKLGLSEQAVMTRACQKWFGRTPTQLRAMMRAER